MVAVVRRHGFLACDLPLSLDMSQQRATIRARQSRDGRTAVSAPPAAGWGHLDPPAHSVQFYADDGFLLDQVSRFAGAALGSGAAAVILATEAHREGLARRLEGRGLGLARAAAQGRYVALDAAETLARFVAHGWPHAARFTEVVGSVIVRATAAARSDLWPRLPGARRRPPVGPGAGPLHHSGDRPPARRASARRGRGAGWLPLRGGPCAAARRRATRYGGVRCRPWQAVRW